MYRKNKYLDTALFVNHLLLKTIALVLLIALFFVGRSMGCFAKLRYTNLFVRSEEITNAKPITMYVDVVDRYGAYLADEETVQLTKKYIKEISKFLYDCYDVEREIPEYNVFLSDEYSDAVTVIDEQYGISVVISNKYMRYSKKALHPIIIHELFHVYNAYDGRNCIYYDGGYVTSALAEGYTEILTDEFCNYYGYDYIKRVDGSEYRYYCYLVEMFLEHDSHLMNQYYFYKDTTFAIKLNKRLRENAKVSDEFLALGYYERSLKGVISSNYKYSKEKFLSTLEITLYYLKSEENPEKYKEYLDDIFKWYEEKYPDNKISDNDKNYLYSIICKK